MASDSARGHQRLLDGVAGVAEKFTGGEFDEQINGARDAADKAVGNE